MSEPMTPAEAADRVDQSPDYDPGGYVRILIDHARATDPALIAALAEEADAIARDLSGPGIVSRAKADAIAERAAALAVALAVPSGGAS